jgi:signal transduction histidine kinase
LQVFLNLSRNSERAMRGSLRKELRVEARREGDIVVVRFRDTGHGVAHQEKLFEPFQPGAHSTGLGLYISRAILRASGGDLRHEPQAQGTCFTVELWPSEDGESG